MNIFSVSPGKQMILVLGVLLTLSFIMAGCSNPGNSLDTGIVEKGLYPSGIPNAKWMHMDNDVVILLKSGNEGKMYFKGMVDPNMFSTIYGNSLVITFIVNGNPVKSETISKLYDGYFDVVSDVPRNKKINVHIKVDKYDTSRKDGLKRSMIAYSLEAR